MTNVFSILGLTLAVGIVAVAFIFGSDTDVTDLGSVSDRWMADHHLLRRDHHSLPR